ncbi:MAG: proliferating cell nuclear antigen (pcna) [Thermoplasmatota archaeon]
MLHARCKADVLRNILDATATLVDEAKLSVTPEGVAIKAVDPAHVAMVDLQLRKSAFEEFKADTMELGLDMDKFKEVLKLAGPEDPVEIDYDAEHHRLVLKIGNLVRRMSLVDVSGMTDPKVPKLDLPAHVTVPASELERGIRASEAVSDHVALIVTPEMFELRAEGDTDTVNLTLARTILPALKTNEKVRSLFSLDYFTNMVKAAKGSEGVAMNLGNDFPVRLEFDIAGGNGHVTYLLAPRIES